MATRKRTIAKSITWRIIASSITFAVSWLVTGHIGVASGIAVVDALVKMVAYYGHERAWLRVTWGRFIK